MSKNAGSGASDGDLEKEVTGEYNTFKVYLLMLRVKRGSAREVQRSLGFSSTWLATHHLEKLEKLGLVRKDEHGDFLVIPRSFGILRFFVVTGRWVVPRMSFFCGYVRGYGCWFPVLSS